jgi:hypothetical protein
LQSHGGGSSAKSWGEALLEVAGTARNLPEDFAEVLRMWACRRNASVLFLAHEHIG